mmetsp:Transcript_467/g.1346  ORF Transcript_467/g.1346 Transcript_467/m.1346 type:complete len:225 (+) Transcript_467:843-1517(+)
MDSPPSRGTVLRVRAHPALPLLAAALLRPARLVHLLSQARPNQRGQHQGVRQGARLPQVAGRRACGAAGAPVPAGRVHGGRHAAAAALRDERQGGHAHPPGRPHPGRRRGPPVGILARQRRGSVPRLQCRVAQRAEAERACSPCHRHNRPGGRRAGVGLLDQRRLHVRLPAAARRGQRGGTRLLRCSRRRGTAAGSADPEAGWSAARAAQEAGGQELRWRNWRR